MSVGDELVVGKGRRGQPRQENPYLPVQKQCYFRKEVPGKSLHFLPQVKDRGRADPGYWTDKPPITTSQILEPPSPHVPSVVLQPSIHVHTNNRMSHPQVQTPRHMCTMTPRLPLEKISRCWVSRHGAIVATSECTPTPATTQPLLENTHDSLGVS